MNAIFWPQLFSFENYFFSNLPDFSINSLGTSERVADIKTRASAMKCLTAFCEAVGPGFVFERVCAGSVNFLWLSFYSDHNDIWLLFVAFQNHERAQESQGS